jgi:hypothetical protein
MKITITRACSATREVAEAIGDGIRQANPDAEAECLQVVDASPELIKGVFGRLLLRYFRCADAGSFRWLWAWRVATSDAATSVAGWHTLSTVGARPNPSPHGKRQQLQSSAGSLRL